MILTGHNQSTWE